MPNSIYDIMIIVAGFYTFALLLGLTVAVVTAKRETKVYKRALESVVDELKDIIIKEEINMTLEDKGAYKNRNTSEGLLGRVISDFMEDQIKPPSLTELISRKATEAEYDELVDMLVELAKRTYNNFKSQIYKSTDELEIPNFIQIRSHYSEEPTLHKKIFQKSVAYGIVMEELIKKFVVRVAAGDVVEIGDNAFVIIDDNTGNSPTGVSPINSGLEDAEITFNIAFISKDNLEAWTAKHFPKEEEGNE